MSEVQGETTHSRCREKKAGDAVRMAKSSLPVGSSRLPPEQPQFAGKGWLERDTQLAGPRPLRIIMEIFESVKEKE